MSEPTDMTRPARPDRPLTMFDTNWLAAWIADDAKLPTKLAALESALPRNDAIWPGMRPAALSMLLTAFGTLTVKKLTTLDTNPLTVLSAPLNTLTMLFHRFWKNPMTTPIAFGTVTVKKFTIASMTTCATC